MRIILIVVFYPMRTIYIFTTRLNITGYLWLWYSLQSTKYWTFYQI